jgi:hypothetical protein
MRRSALAATVLIAALTLGLEATARAGTKTYVVAGRDSFSIGDNDISSEIAYSGTQRMTWAEHGRFVRYHANVSYTRDDGTATTSASCDYVADVLASGRTLATANHDPDYLTVLNQPFAARLDPATLADLRSLRGAVPFDFPAPFTGASLHGYLRHLPSGFVGPRRSIGVKFEAAGSMRGALPDRPGLTLRGTITMRGTAYYDAATALLLALDTTVTISGNVSNRAGKDPVTITFSRSMRAKTT